ncbi:MAG: hypothetical protein J4472_01435 [DPANN group archaeon]|nr:hypothetical protein [DPANN group archaeon]
MAVKKFWKCKVCGDVHYGVNGPEICPTCHQKNSYGSISGADAKKALKF